MQYLKSITLILLVLLLTHRADATEDDTPKIDWTETGLQSVALEFDPLLNTPVKDQGKVNFCWAYTLAGWLESQALKRDHVTLDLSEEYLGFYHLFKEFRDHIPLFESSRQFDKNLSQIYFIPAIWEQSTSDFVQFVLTPRDGNVFETALDELAEFGIVPEEIFHIKFESNENKDVLEERVTQFVRNDYLLNLDKYKKDPGALFASLAKVFGKTPPRKDEFFTYAGTIYTPLTFLKDYLKFERKDYAVLKFSPETHELGLNFLRQAIRDEGTVPIALTILQKQNPSGPLPAKGSGVFRVSDCEGSCTLLDRHAVLATNFAVSKEKSSSGEPHELGILVKNSWGTSGLNASGGKASKPEESGYDLVTHAYLKEGFKHFGYWEMVVRSTFDLNVSTTP